MIRRKGEEGEEQVLSRSFCLDVLFLLLCHPPSFKDGGEGIEKGGGEKKHSVDDQQRREDIEDTEHTKKENNHIPVLTSIL